MKKKKSIQVIFNENQLPIIKPTKNTHLTYDCNTDGSINIKGNKKGLLLLAQAALGMAECERLDGYHIHIDDLYEINSDDKSIIISKD